MLTSLLLAWMWYIMLFRLVDTDVVTGLGEDCVVYVPTCTA